MTNIFAIVVVLLAGGCATTSSNQSEACAAFTAGSAELHVLRATSDRASQKYEVEPTDKNLQEAAAASTNAAQAAADLAVVEYECEESRRAP